MTKEGEAHKLLNDVVRRLGLEPRTLALKGKHLSPLNSTLSNNTHSSSSAPLPHVGPFWGPLKPVHGHNTDSLCLVVWGWDCDSSGSFSRMFHLWSIQRSNALALIRIVRPILEGQQSLQFSSCRHVLRSFSNKDEIPRAVHHCGQHVSISTPVPLSQISRLTKPQYTLIGICHCVETREATKRIQCVDDVGEFTPGKQYFAHYSSFQSRIQAEDILLPSLSPKPTCLALADTRYHSRVNRLRKARPYSFAYMSQSLGRSVRVGVRAGR